MVKVNTLASKQNVWDISSQCWNIYNTFTSIFPYKNYVIYYHNAKNTMLKALEYV